MTLNSIIKKSRDQDLASVMLPLVDKVEKIMGDDWEASSFEMLRNLANDPDSKWTHYTERILREVDPHILKTFLLNAGYEAGFRGYKTSCEMKKKHGCNIPWIILMDPTTACNLHCTGCWAAEYGNRLNLSFEEMDKFRKHIEKDSALERRFQPVTVNEPSMEDTLKILKGIAHYYESFHGVKIPDGILRQAVVLSERYITDRFLPDKAIDLIDEACSDMNLHDKNINRRMELRRELDDYAKERELLEAETENPDFERLAELKSLELQAQSELDGLCAQGDPELTMDNLARVIELWTKIPASRIREAEFKRLSELADRLKKHIIGQDEAVDAVAAAIRRGRVGISPKHKPVSFIFVGPTGVGKTELVKQLAADLFDSPDSLIRLDMSEFMEKHSVSRLVGSPPGYVGYDEAGQLTEKIRRKPYAVILFDEIEKAHPDVLNVLLQILDDGEVTDAHGRKVNFENTVIVMTSNAGSDRKEGSVGFGRSVSEQNRERTMKALGEFLRPEFINRVDEIICFNRLDEKNFVSIARIMLDELAASLKEKGFTFTYDDAVAAYLANKSYSLTYGARNLRRTIQKELEDVIATRIIDSYDHPVTQLRAVMKDGAIDLLSL